MARATTPPRIARRRYLAAALVSILVAASTAWMLGRRHGLPPRRIVMATGPEGGGYAVIVALPRAPRRARGSTWSCARPRAIREEPGAAPGSALGRERRAAAGGHHDGAGLTPARVARNALLPAGVDFHRGAGGAALSRGCASRSDRRERHPRARAQAAGTGRRRARHLEPRSLRPRARCRRADGRNGLTPSPSRRRGTRRR